MKVHKSILTLTGAHFLIDNYSSMLGAFIPFLHQKLHLTLSEAGVLGAVLMVSSSLLQPLYGYLADRFQRRLFTALAPAFAGIFISSLGLAPNFWTLALLLFLGGIGIASFHPQGAAMTSQASEGRGFEMSVFISGGFTGYSIGPIFISSVIALGGLERSYWAALPGILMSLYLIVRGPSPQKREAAHPDKAVLKDLKSKLRPLATLYFLVVIRSAIQVVFVAFLPLYFTLRGYSEIRSSQFLSLFLLAGGIAGFLGGILADRLGGKRIIAISMLGALPALLGFLWTSGALSVFLCALGGAFILSTSPVNVVMGQRLVPKAASTISALMMGFAWGTGGLVVLSVGALSDAVGLQLTLTGLVTLALPGFILALTLPSSPHPGSSPQAEVSDLRLKRVSG